jgi:hypothetical protein
LVAGLGQRVQCLLPRGTSSWRQLAGALADACAIPQSYRLQLRALCCWAAGSSEERPLLVRGSPPLSAAYREAARRGLTPLLGLLLASAPPEATPGLLAELLRLARGGSAGAGGDSLDLARHMHCLDVVGMDAGSE